MDVTARKIQENALRQLERRQAMEHAVTRLLADMETVGATMPKVIRTICQTLGWDCGAHWQLDKQGGVLKCLDTWSAGADALREFSEYSGRQSFAPTSAGLIRRASTTGRPV